MYVRLSFLISVCHQGENKGEQRGIEERLRPRFADHLDVRCLGNAQNALAHHAADAQALIARIRAKFPSLPILTVPYEPVTGSHVGPGALALFYISRTERAV